MFWLRNKKIIFLVGTLNKRPGLKSRMFSYPSVLTFVLDAQKNRIIETVVFGAQKNQVLFNTHNICFGSEIRKLILFTCS